MPVFILALSSSVMLLFTTLPDAPRRSSCSFRNPFTFATDAFSVLICFARAVVSFSSSSVESEARWRFTRYFTARSIFSTFFAKSARVPLHSFDAFDGSFTPSIANISRPISPASSQISSTSRYTDTISASRLAMNPAIVVKCGVVSADSAMNTTFSRHSRAISRLWVTPRA